ncbi:hypothetical protein LKD70_09765 [Ruminococcus sp. CLA-AA-H200]|uniref:Uncharacterized protein n=1 Tax=Ruminococcus turbiniformis TaxID=2881258 RepID=A0ABS8FXJ9_9FIRM|nr:hypothetical protein [Ruminococcus turbiniformis]MCC2254701.1 hypothetical protein [Ruminococcus turbiniformis]
MAVLAAGTGDVKDETKILWRTKVQFITHMSCYNLFIKCKKKNRLWEIVVLATERIREGRMQSSLWLCEAVARYSGGNGD